MYIPNILEYTCKLFFNKMREIFRLRRIWISKDLLTASEDCQRFRKTSEDCRRFPMTSEDFPTTSEDNQWWQERCSTTSKQGQQQFPKDFQPILSIIKKYQRCSDFSNAKKTIELFNQFLINYTRFCQLGVRNKSECMRSHFRSPSVRLAHDVWDLAGTMYKQTLLLSSIHG